MVDNIDKEAYALRGTPWHAEAPQIGRRSLPWWKLEAVKRHIGAIGHKRRQKVACSGGWTEPCRFPNSA